MRARLLRAMFLGFLAVMLAAYVASVANGSAPDGVHDNLQVVGEQWC